MTQLARVSDVGTFRSLMDRMKPDIGRAVGKLVSPDRFIRMALTCVQKTPDLLKCTQASLIGALVEVAQLGLEPGTALGQAYVIPYGDKAQLVLGYKGLINLAYRSPRISHIEARAVFEGDDFSYSYGTGAKLTHVPSADAASTDDPAKMTHTYALVTFSDGRQEFDVMSKAQIGKIRQRSRAKASGPWQTDEVEMSKKCPVRRLMKMLPLTVEAATAIAKDEQLDAGVEQTFEFESELEEAAKPAVPKEMEGRRMQLAPTPEPGSAG